MRYVCIDIYNTTHKILENPFEIGCVGIGGFDFGKLSMEIRRVESVLGLVALFCFWASANSLLSPKGVNYEGK